MKMKKLLAILLSVILLLSSITSTLTGLLVVSAEETTTEETSTTITESPTAYLYEQAVALATAEGADSPTESTNRIAITQNGAWRVESAGVSNTTETATISRDWADTTSLWVISSASNIRYGHSSWSRDCAHIRVGYKDGDSSNGKALAAYLYPKKNNNDGDRRNAFLGLYYIAETSGEYTLSDNYGGFTVRDSAAEGYEVYVTIYANGVEIFKSQPLTRINRIAKLEDTSFYLEEGQKLEIKFTYEYTAETYTGDITIDFDPKLTLVDEYVEETVTPEAIGDIPAYVFDLMDAQTAENNGAITQSSPWRIQGYNGSVWKDCGYIYKGATDTNSQHYRYMYGTSNSKHSNIGVRYYNSKLGNPMVFWTLIPFNNSKRPMRLSYTAEADGVYTLSDKYGVFTARKGTLVYYEIYAYVTVNGEKIWESEETLRAVDDTITFNPLQFSMDEGDVMTITFNYKVRSDLEEGVTAETGGMFYTEFAPELSYLPPAKTENYPIEDTFQSVFDEILASETVATSGTVTQDDANWRFKYGTSFEGLTDMTNYSLNTDATYGEIRLHGNTTASSAYPSFTYGTGSSETYGLVVIYRNRMSGGSINTNGYHYDFAYTFTATRKGVHVLDESTYGYSSLYDKRIPGVLKIYKNSNLIYTSATINSELTSTTIPQMNILLDAGDELTFYFERLDADTTVSYNNHYSYYYVPNITYREDIVAVSKFGYTPEHSTRYYAEGLTVPSTVSAYVNTSAIVPGNVIASDLFSLEILTNGNLAVTYLNGDTEKQIVFPVDVKGSWNKVTVTYDSENSVWSCAVNDIELATVEDADFVAGDAIDKLYIGASDDIYNNGSFEGEIAELSLSDGTSTTSYTLTDITAEEGLTAENVAFESDCSETYLTFINKNYRYDLYENFDVPVSTFEAWVRLETDYVDGKSAGRLLGNSYNYKPYSQINIASNGRPQVYTCDADGNSATVTFDIDIRSDEFVHLAIVADTQNGIYSCYIDGVLADTVESSMVIPVGTRPYLISGDYFYNNTPVSFEGDLAGVAMYSDVRTEEEILADMYGEADLTDEALLGKWSMADNEEGLINQNGNGNDLHPFWEDEADCTVDESYGDYSTFVFIPDTQNFTQSQGDTGLNSIANWVINNKDTENIVGVIGLGDITNNNTTDQWADAKTSFDKLKGVVPYVFVQGNHDIGSATTDEDGNTVYRNTTNMNTYFPLDDWKPYLTGYFEEGKIDNIYTLTEDNKGIKYMLLGLEFQPRDEVLEWANEVVAAHPDYNVIVSTHGYQNYSYYTKEQYYISSNSYESKLSTYQNTGDAIWEKFASKHANITTVVCGHVYHEDIHVTTNIGDNGNTVTEIIANAQTTDALMRQSGTIMIVRVSEDGTKANVNYYSPYHNHYLKDLNQFEIDWNTILPASTAVAEADGVEYDTLAEAVAAGTDIKLLCDAEGEGFVINKDVTIDFGGYTYTVTSPVGSTGTVSNGLQLLQGNNVTLKNGTLTVSAESKNDFYILVQNYSNLTVTDMVLDGTNLDKYSLTDGDSYTLSNNCGDININGSTTIIANDEGDLAFAFDIYKYADYTAPTVNVDTTGKISGTIEISAGLESNISITNGIFTDDVSAYIGEGSGMKLVDGIHTVAASAVICDVDNDDKVAASDLIYLRGKLMDDIIDNNYFDTNGDGVFNAIDIVRAKKLCAE